MNTELIRKNNSMLSFIVNSFSGVLWDFQWIFLELLLEVVVMDVSDRDVV